MNACLNINIASIVDNLLYMLITIRQDTAFVISKVREDQLFCWCASRN